jgi:O-antigen biosynthesis protein
MSQRDAALASLASAINGSSRPRLLLITHAWGGGVERHVQDLLALIRAKVDVLVLRGFLDGGVELAWHGQEETPVTLRVGGFGADTLSQWRDALIQLDFARIHIHHLHGWPREILELVAQLRLPIDITLHDYFYPCPQYHLSDENDRYCGEPDLAGCRACVAKRPHVWGLQIDAWRETMGALLARADRVIAPSRDVATRTQRYFPSIKPIVAPHFEYQTVAPIVHKVAILGGLSRVKGLDTVRSVVAYARIHAPSLDFKLIGHASDPLPPGITATGTYDDRDLGRLIASERPDVIWFPSQVPETFSYTLSVALASGVRIVASDLGSFRERMAPDASHQLLPHTADAQAWIAALGAGSKQSNHPSLRNNPPFHSTPDDSYAAMYLAPVEHAEQSMPIATSFVDLLLNAATAPTLPDRGALGLFRIGRYAGHRASLDAIEQQLAALPLHESHIVGRSIFNALSDHRDRLIVAYEHTTAALDQTKAHVVRVQEEYRAATVRHADEVQRMQRDARNAMAHIAYVEGEVQRIVTSRSWRYTKPLRGAVRLARRLPRLLRAAARVLTTDRDVIVRGLRVLRNEGVRGAVERVRREVRKSSLPNVNLALANIGDGEMRAFRLPTSDQPVLSILIPVFEQHNTTYDCIASIAAHFPNCATEIVVSDDASPTPVSTALAMIDGIRVVRQAQNQGFIKNVNAGAAACRGEYLLILNNDTIITAGAIDAMISTFHFERNVGLVGAKLLNADGSIQEAGGIVWQDGSAWNYGRGEHALDPRFNFLRDADYCSGAALMLRRELFSSLNGFDERYLPAYYEDTDLAFRIRQTGLRVVYQPFASIYHLEGVSHGKDPSTGIKAYQDVNAKKFFDRWRDTLSTHRTNGVAPHLEARRQTRGDVLVVEACMITPDQDSGSIRLRNLMKLMREEGHHVIFLAENLEGTGKYRNELEALGVEVLYDAWAGSVRSVLRERGRELSAILLCRHYVAHAHLHDARRYAPQARIIFDTVDVHFLREEREAALTESSSLAKKAIATKQQELAMVVACDATLVVSEVEQTLLRSLAPGKEIFLLSNVHESESLRPGFDERAGVVFVGGFRHPPNIDAVSWFAQDVLPHLRALDASIETTIVGSNMPESLRALAQPGLTLAGHVPDLKPVLRQARVSIAPLRYGAGVKGKVNEAMNFGIPVVATTVAMEGMHVTHDVDCLIADDPESFARHIVNAHNDKEIWERLSANGIVSVEQHFSFERAREALRRVIGVR